MLALIGGGTALVTRVRYGRAWQPASAAGVIGLGVVLGDLLAAGLAP